MIKFSALSLGERDEAGDEEGVSVENRSEPPVVSLLRDAMSLRDVGSWSTMLGLEGTLGNTTEAEAEAEADTTAAEEASGRHLGGGCEGSSAARGTSKEMQAPYLMSASSSVMTKGWNLGGSASPTALMYMPSG